MTGLTLKTIASLTGVSVSTVSRIINSLDDTFASKEVRDRVWAAIQETGYIPNPSARALRLKVAGKTASGPSLLTVILGRTHKPDDNPFFAQVSRAIEQQSLNMGHSISRLYSILDTREGGALAKIEPARTDGAFVLGRVDPKMIPYLEKRYKNIIYIGRNVIDAAWDQVICDGYEATRVALEYLIAKGHRQIGYIGERSEEIRWSAYIDTLAKHDLEINGGWVADCVQNSAGGYSGAEKLLEKARPLPTAIFCAADAAAIAAMRRFHEAKIKIPRQLSIIGMDNIDLSGYVSPMLSTIEMPIVEMAGAAVKTLLDRIDKRHKLPMKIFLPGTLIPRESVREIQR
ncbi:MAG: LacI family transcriptional regulator [Clostridiales bacterium]|nr:LacI family transcriptional regulator [Clostridiales bacterium]